MIPQLRMWHEKYEAAGLTIVGVHTLGVRAWPTTLLVDKQGILRYRHIGEGDYEATDAVIRRLIVEGG